MGRLVYDNITNTKVFDYMALAAPLTMSASARYPLGPQQHCGSIYGDAASVMDLTELIGAVTGYPFGQPANFTYNGTMPCANDTNYTDDTKDLPRAPVQGLPPVLDMHTTPGCYNQNTNGACDQSSASLETSQAQYFFNDFWSFMMNHGITGYLAMFGELPNNQGCDFQTAQDASTATAGYLLSSLFTNASSHTVLRPWENSTNSCYAMPATIGSPTGPYAR
jgi:hypothetical protein